MAQLVTYDAAVAHLKQNGVLDVSPEDPDLAAKVAQASAIVEHHLKRHGEWTVDTDPDADPEFLVVQALVMKVLGHLYGFRGDDPKEPSLEDVLRNFGSSLYRDPAFE